jgi:hypothetical protein
MVAGIVYRRFRKILLGCFQFLQANYIGFGFLQPAKQNRQPAIHAVNIIGGYSHIEIDDINIEN